MTSQRPSGLSRASATDTDCASSIRTASVPVATSTRTDRLLTTHEYDVVERYRDLGGNLAFLSANNFFWQVVKRGGAVTKTKQWRELDRPEAALLGVQYRGNDSGEARWAWLVRDVPAADWLFAGTGLRPGSRFGEDWASRSTARPQPPRRGFR